MTRLIAACAVLAATAACGVGMDEQLAGQQQDELRVLEEADGAMWRFMNAGRAEYCRAEMLRPVTQGTIQNIPKLGIYGRAPVGDEVQSSYFQTNAVNEEIRRGIVEFYVPGAFESAVLHFRENRGWTSHPLPADSHLLMAYPGNLELDVDDFETRAVTVGRFETDPNLEPRLNVAYDMTKALRELGPKFGLRFQLENIEGQGTSFADLTLEVTRCREIVRPIN